jgi:hypothetical protein
MIGAIRTWACDLGFAAGYPSPDPAATWLSFPSAAQLSCSAKGFFIMTTNVAPWFKEFIKDKVYLDLQANGGHLDNTMIRGDVEAGIIKFPFMSGRSEMYKITGALRPVPFNSKGLSTIQVTPEDFQATEHWFTQDAYKSGPSEQAALVNLLSSSVRRRRDKFKLDALTAFQAANPGTVTTIGTGPEVPDVIHFETARTQIAGIGDMSVDGNVFCMIPEMWMTQLSFYKEYANADWTGPENAPFSKAQRARMRTIRGIHYFTVPDEYFVSPAGQPTQLYAWMWHKDALGAEEIINLETAMINKRIDLEGHPYQADVFCSGAAIGLRPQLVKRFLLQKIAVPTRPV